MQVWNRERSNWKEHKSWITSYVRCPLCNFEFNFRHSKWISVVAVKSGRTWIFRCPSCHERVRFILKRGANPDIPTFSDEGFGGFTILSLLGLVSLSITLSLMYIVSARIFEIGIIPMVFAFAFYLLLSGKTARDAARISRDYSK